MGGGRTSRPGRRFDVRDVDGRADCAVFGGETRTNRLKIATKLKTAPKEVWQRQRPLVLKWKATEGENEPWRVRLSTRPDFSDGRDLWFDRRALAHGPVEDGKSVLWTCPVPLANLELGKTYYWQVWSDVKCSEFRCGFTYLDLRSPREVAGMKESPLGPKVRFVNVSSETYQGLFTDVGKAAMAKNFRLFCDRSNYPIYFHCIHGADRTGSLAYVLNGILGVAKEDLEREWEARTYPKLSGVRNPWGERACAHYDRGFAQYGKPDDPLAERIRLYLLDCGITQSEIDTFKSIMLDSHSTP